MPPFLRNGLVFLLVLIAGGVFVVAGALKSLDPEGFARDIALHGLIGPGLSSIAARVLVPFEIVVGAAAIVGWRRRWALGLLILTLAVFIAATGYAWASGNTEGCGCFGRFASRSPLAVIVEDALLIAAGLLALRLGRGREEPRRPAAGVFLAGLLLVSTAFTLAAPRLPIDNIATALRPGVTLADLGLDRIPGNLVEGERLLVVLVLDQPASQKGVSALNALAEIPGVPTIDGLTAATEDQRAEFFWNHAPAFDLLEVPASDLRRLYRRAPRTFRVHNGRVLRVWEGVPPAEELTK